MKEEVFLNSIFFIKGKSDENEIRINEDNGLVQFVTYENKKIDKRLSFDLPEAKKIIKCFKEILHLLKKNLYEKMHHQYNLTKEDNSYHYEISYGKNIDEAIVRIALINKDEIEVDIVIYGNQNIELIILAFEKIIEEIEYK